MEDAMMAEAPGSGHHYTRDQENGTRPRNDVPASRHDSRSIPRGEALGGHQVREKVSDAASIANRKLEAGGMKYAEQEDCVFFKGTPAELSQHLSKATSYWPSGSTGTVLVFLHGVGVGAPPAHPTPSGMPAQGIVSGFKTTETKPMYVSNAENQQRIEKETTGSRHRHQSPCGGNRGRSRSSSRGWNSNRRSHSREVSRDSSSGDHGRLFYSERPEHPRRSRSRSRGRRSYDTNNYRRRSTSKRRGRDGQRSRSRAERPRSDFYEGVSLSQRITARADAPRAQSNHPSRREKARILHDKDTQQRRKAPFFGKFKLSAPQQMALELKGYEALGEDRYGKGGCANCGHWNHWLGDCAFPDDSGFIMGCPLCNSKNHVWDECKRGQALSLEERFLLIIARRAKKPAIRSNVPWVDLLGEVVRASKQHLFKGIRGMPWTRVFTLEMISRPKSAHSWLQFDPSDVRNFPQDPTTKGVSLDEVAKIPSLAREVHHPDSKKAARNVEPAMPDADVDDVEVKIEPFDYLKLY
ncbi:hypothetical protein EsH8_I_000403 [Colletotrichum jinshuiense]